MRVVLSVVFFYRINEFVALNYDVSMAAHLLGLYATLGLLEDARSHYSTSYRLLDRERLNTLFLAVCGGAVLVHYAFSAKQYLYRFSTHCCTTRRYLAKSYYHNLQ